MRVKYMSYRVQFQGTGAARIHRTLWLDIVNIEKKVMSELDVNNQLWSWKYSHIFLFLIQPHFGLFFFAFLEALGLLFWPFGGCFWGRNQY